MVSCSSIVPARSPAMVTMSCPTCTPASFILSKELSHFSYFHIFHTFCTLFSELKERGGPAKYDCGKEEGIELCRPCQMFQWGRGVGFARRLEDRRTRISRIKSGTEIGGGVADKGEGGGVSDVWIGVKEGHGYKIRQG